MQSADLSGYLLYPQPDSDKLTQTMYGQDQQAQAISVNVVSEHALTLYLNKQEIITLMTLGDHPQYLAVGFLLNQNIILIDRRER